MMNMDTNIRVRNVPISKSIKQGSFHRVEDSVGSKWAA